MEQQDGARPPRCSFVLSGSGPGRDGSRDWARRSVAAPERAMSRKRPSRCCLRSERGGRRRRRRRSPTPLDDLRCAGGVVPSVQGQGAGLQDHQARPRMRVPAEAHAWRDLVLEHVEIRLALCIDPGCQLLESVFASISPKCPCARGMPVTPTGGVASTAPAAYAVTPTTADDEEPLQFPLHRTPTPSALKRAPHGFAFPLWSWSQGQHDAECKQRRCERGGCTHASVGPVEAAVTHADDDRGRSIAVRVGEGSCRRGSTSQQPTTAAPVRRTSEALS